MPRVNGQPGASWLRLVGQLRDLLQNCQDPTAGRATAVALLHHKIPGVSWTGFYMLREGRLIVDVYQGPVACLSLAPNQGVCWKAIDRGECIIVPDVSAFPGHIACDGRTRSEIVLPFFNAEGRICGVLDVDSRRPEHFTSSHEEGYRAILQLLECS